jgi:hypothetical protein
MVCLLAPFAVPAHAGVGDELQSCRAEDDADARLACYDEVAARAAPPRFSGRLHKQTEPFTIDRPHVLRYRSNGPIFVLYLKNEAGGVVQNLHVGGVGEGRHRIAEPGTYFLQIDGAESWDIWLDPES